MIYMCIQNMLGDYSILLLSRHVKRGNRSIVAMNSLQGG